MHSLNKKAPDTVNLSDTEGIAPYGFPDFATPDPPSSGIKDSAKRGFQRILFPGESTDAHRGGPKTEDREGLLEETRNQAREIRKRAYDEGFAEGEQKGKEAVNKKFEALCNSFAMKAEELNRFKAEIYREVEKEVVELALVLGKKIVGHELSVNPESLLHVVRSALEHTVDRHDLRIRVNPSDYAWVQGEFSRSLNEEWMGKVEFEPDAAVQTGGCVIRSRFGIVDARIERQIEALEAALKKTIEYTP